MLDVLHQLGLGFLHLAQPANAAALVVGLVVGMLVAVLPGLTLVMGVVLALPFANFALRFDTPEYFAVVIFGLTGVAALGSGSLANALISLCIGLLLATVGVDPLYGAERFAFGVPILKDGIEYLTV